MVKGSTHFPVYYCDTSPHKATGNKAMTLWDKITGDCLGIESSPKEEFKQLCIPKQARSFLELLPAFASAEAGTLLSPSIPLMVATLGNQMAHLIGLFTWKHTHIHTNTERESTFNSTSYFCLFVCFPCLLRQSLVPLKNKRDVLVSIRRRTVPSLRTFYCRRSPTDLI